MLPIYLFYSMFGFQRIGDLTWLLGDIRGRGILAGCTAGRTTLQGEGLQHDDGHSPLLASVNPAARIYDPAFAYEIAVIMEEAVARTLGPEPEDRFWYLTLYNENYVMPALPAGEAGATDPGRDPPGHVPLRRTAGRVRRLGSGDGSRTHGRPRCCSRARCGRRPWRRATCWPRDWAVGHRRLVGDLVHRAPRRRPVGRTLQPAPPGRGAPDPLSSPRPWPRAGRWWR